MTCKGSPKVSQKAGHLELSGVAKINDKRKRETAWQSWANLLLVPHLQPQIKWALPRFLRVLHKEGRGGF